jgi:hypothetical protein
MGAERLWKIAVFVFVTHDQSGHPAIRVASMKKDTGEENREKSVSGIAFQQYIKRETNKS